MSCKCSCASGLANLGYPACESVYGITTKLILVPLLGSTGVLNSYDPAVAFDQAFLDLKINALNHLDRWYPTPLIENILDETADNVFETSEGGSAYYVKDGVRKVTGYFFNVSQKFACKLSGNNCGKFGVYMVDNCGNILGVDKGDGKLYPIPVQDFNSKVMPKTPTTVAKVMFSFEFLQTVGACSLETVNSEFIDADVLGANGLLNSLLSVVTSVPNTLTFKLTSEYGSLGNKQAIKGVTLADIVSLTNVTTSTALGLTSLTESTTVDGQYVLVYTGTAVATDQLSIKFTGVVDGYDYAIPNSNLIPVA